MKTTESHGGWGLPRVTQPEDSPCYCLLLVSVSRPKNLSTGETALQKVFEKYLGMERLHAKAENLPTIFFNITTSTLILEFI